MRERLMEGATGMGIALSEEAIDSIVRFHGMLTEKNRSLNLTRVPSDEAEAVDRNYLDSLSLLAVTDAIQGARTLLDVGTGAGFPGLVLSCARPDLQVTLLDAQNKRVEFLREVINALSLNARALHGRAEEIGRGALREGSDLATARAVAPIRVLCEWTLPLVRIGGEAVYWKGPGATRELEEARRAISLLGGEVAAVESVRIPGRDWTHCLVRIRKVSPTPDTYPRRPGVAGRRPL